MGGDFSMKVPNILLLLINSSNARRVKVPYEFIWPEEWKVDSIVSKTWNWLVMSIFIRQQEVKNQNHYGLVQAVNFCIPSSITRRHYSPLFSQVLYNWSQFEDFGRANETIGVEFNQQVTFFKTLSRYDTAIRASPIELQAVIDKTRRIVEELPLSGLRACFLVPKFRRLFSTWGVKTSPTYHP